MSTNIHNTFQMTMSNCIYGFSVGSLLFLHAYIILHSYFTLVTFNSNCLRSLHPSRPTLSEIPCNQPLLTLNNNKAFSVVFVEANARFSEFHSDQMVRPSFLQLISLICPLPFLFQAVLVFSETLALLIWVPPKNHPCTLHTHTQAVYRLYKIWDCWYCNNVASYSTVCLMHKLF